MDDLEREHGAADGPDGESASHLNMLTREEDPQTWFGLIWRVVGAAVESNANLVRTCVLIVFVAAALRLIGGMR